MLKKLFQEIDQAWKPMGIEPIPLKIIGSTALFLQCNYERGTKDSDVLEVHETPNEVFKTLKKMAGKDSMLAKRHGMYVDIVGSGFAFLPQSPFYHPVPGLDRELRHFRIQVMDVTDVVVSKLKRFSAGDIKDIRAVTELGLINQQKLIERFLSAKAMWELGSRAPELPKHIENLHTVERDFLAANETPIELPDWLD